MTRSVKYRKGGFVQDETPKTMDTMNESIVSQEQPQQQGQPQNQNLYMVMSEYISIQNFVIVILVFMLILSFLGVNLLLILGKFLQAITMFIQPLVDKIWSVFGYTTGTIINVSADTVGDVAKTSIDIAEGTVHSIGNLLQNSSNINGNLVLKSELNSAFVGEGPLVLTQPTPSPYYSYPAEVQQAPLPILPVPIPTPTPTIAQDFDSLLNTSPSSSSSATATTPFLNQWCLVGEFNGQRSCIEVGDPANCMSMQTFQDQQQCLGLEPGTSMNNSLAINQQIPVGQNWGIPPPPLMGPSQPGFPGQMGPVPGYMGPPPGQMPPPPPGYMGPPPGQMPPPPPGYMGPPPGQMPPPPPGYMGPPPPPPLAFPGAPPLLPPAFQGYPVPPINTNLNTN